MKVLVLLGVCENRALYKNKPTRRLYLPTHRVVQNDQKSSPKLKHRAQRFTHDVGDKQSRDRRQSHIWR